ERPPIAVRGEWCVLDANQLLGRREQIVRNPCRNAVAENGRVRRIERNREAWFELERCWQARGHRALRRAKTGHPVRRDDEERDDGDDGTHPGRSSKSPAVGPLPISEDRAESGLADTPRT